MKKLLLSVLSVVLFCSLALPAYAEEGNPSQVEEEREFSYEYNGVEFTGNSPLSEEQLEGLYLNAIGEESPSPNEGIGTFAVEPGSSVVTVVPPTYRVHKRTYESATIAFYVAYFIGKAVRVKNEAGFKAWGAAMLATFVSTAVPSAYTGSWIVSSWSAAQNKRVYHATLVHYSDSAYKKPKKIQYYDCTSWYN